MNDNISDEMSRASSDLEDYQDYHIVEENRQELIKDTILPLHKKIEFRSNTNIRRCINKYIVNYILKNYNSNELRAKYNQCNLSLSHNVHTVFEQIKIIHRSDNCKKDYAKFIKTMMCFAVIRKVVKCHLELLRENFSDGRYGLIRASNRIFYLQTVEDYQNYIDDIEVTLIR